MAASAVQQAVQDKTTKYSLGWHGGDKVAFLEAAKSLPHPAHDEHLGLPQILLDVIEFVVGKREKMAQWRVQRLALLRDAAALVAPMRRAMPASVKPHILHTIESHDPAFTAVWS